MSGLLVLAGSGESSSIVVNRLRKEFGDFPVILEPHISRVQLIYRRAKRLGVFNALGQILFVGFMWTWLKRVSQQRITEIKRQHALDESSPVHNVHRVDSVNCTDAHRLLSQFAPSLVVVIGTRILSRRTLEVVNVPFVNMHSGITPAFRGCHGAYWAHATNRPNLAGTTIHWINTGIDTGGVIKQVHVTQMPGDCFVTYSLLQLAAGLPLLVSTIRECFAGNVEIFSLPDDERGVSHLYHHPTIWFYLWKRLRYGVK
jgi:phosphoribosylglycinamide formyltransferase-1